MFLYLMMGLVGAALGSFASVLIARSDDPRRVIWAADGAPARSACPACNRFLTALNLLPIFGWMLARGRCRGCGATIGLWYLILEIIAAGVMIAAFVALSFTPAFFIFLPLILMPIL